MNYALRDSLHDLALFITGILTVEGDFTILMYSSSEGLQRDIIVPTNRHTDSVQAHGCQVKW